MMAPRPPIHEVLAEQIKIQREEFGRIGPIMERLLENKDFQEFIKIGRAQADGHLLHLRKPLEKQGEVYQQEYRKGAVFGIETLLATPERIVETANDLRRKDQDDAARRQRASRQPDPNADTESERGVVTADSNLEPDNS